MLPKPNGAKIQQIALPSIPSTLFSNSISKLKPKEPSIMPNIEPAHMIIDDNNMMVPAFLIKEEARSHIERKRLDTVGI